MEIEIEIDMATLNKIYKDIDIDIDADIVDFLIDTDCDKVFDIDINIDIV